MPRHSDASPVPQTCPKIDSAISIVHGIYIDYEDFSKQTYVDFEKTMEEIRSANSTLREWGNEEYKRANEMEDERDDLLRMVDDLKSEIGSLKSEIKELENELQQL